MVATTRSRDYTFTPSLSSKRQRVNPLNKNVVTALLPVKSILHSMLDEKDAARMMSLGKAVTSLLLGGYTFHGKQHNARSVVTLQRLTGVVIKGGKIGWPVGPGSDPPPSLDRPIVVRHVLQHGLMIPKLMPLQFSLHHFVETCARAFNLSIVWDLDCTYQSFQHNPEAWISFVRIQVGRRGRVADDTLFIYDRLGMSSFEPSICPMYKDHKCFQCGCVQIEDGLDICTQCVDSMGCKSEDECFRCLNAVRCERHAAPSTPAT